MRSVVALILNDTDTLARDREASLIDHRVVFKAVTAYFGGYALK